VLKAKLNWVVQQVAAAKCFHPAYLLRSKFNEFYTDIKINSVNVNGDLKNVHIFAVYVNGKL
jgi:hypothetical protein